jgi:hypothetical protein
VQRLVASSLKPLAAVLLLTILFTWTRSSSSSPKNKKPTNPHPKISRAVVIASTATSNLTWLDAALQNSHWKPYIYVTDSSSPSLPENSLTVPKNKGNEAMVYLTWIIDNYHNLPDVAFFHHHHNQAWHQQFSSSFELERLNVANVVKQGYVSPRCLPGCENVMTLTGDVAPLEDLKTASREVMIASVLHAFWRNAEGERKEIPKEIAAPCCAQFAVSKERILNVDLGVWKALREWLIQTEVPSGQAGRILEYTWHLWFGKEAVL